VIASGTTIAPDSNWMWSWAFLIHRAIDPHPGYAIDSDGWLWSLWTNRHLGKVWRRRIPTHAGGPYRYHMLRSADGQRRKRYVHRLVLEAFVGPCPPGMIACHNNGVPTDNRARNLRWDTPAGNAQDSIGHGTISRKGTRVLGSRNHSTKLSEDAVRAIRAERASGAFLRDLARRHGVDKSTIRALLSGQTCGHVL
jgi:hypothetical protein